VVTTSPVTLLEIRGSVQGNRELSCSFLWCHQQSEPRLPLIGSDLIFASDSAIRRFTRKLLKTSS